MLLRNSDVFCFISVVAVVGRPVLGRFGVWSDFRVTKFILRYFSNLVLLFTKKATNKVRISIDPRLLTFWRFPIPLFITNKYYVIAKLTLIFSLTIFTYLIIIFYYNY